MICSGVVADTPARSRFLAGEHRFCSRLRGRDAVTPSGPTIALTLRESCGGTVQLQIVGCPGQLLPPASYYSPCGSGQHTPLFGEALAPLVGQLSGFLYSPGRAALPVPGYCEQAGPSRHPLSLQSFAWTYFKVRSVFLNRIAAFMSLSTCSPLLTQAFGRSHVNRCRRDPVDKDLS